MSEKTTDLNNVGRIKVGKDGKIQTDVKGETHYFVGRDGVLYLINQKEYEKNLQEINEEKEKLKEAAGDFIDQIKSDLDKIREKSEKSKLELFFEFFSPHKAYFSFILATTAVVIIDSGFQYLLALACAFVFLSVVEIIQDLI